MSNVVVFPKWKKETPPQSLEELFAKIEETRSEHIQYLVNEEIVPSLLNALHYEGFNLLADECDAATNLFIESFKAALYKASNLEHPLHDMADDFWEWVNTDDESVEENDNC